MAPATKKYSTYRGYKLSDAQQGVLSWWPNEKDREEEIKFILKGITKREFSKSFFGVLERDRIEAEKTGKKWPEDYLEKMK